ncbi:unnamed protein product [Cylicostephanus goldi]|uniref:G-protein coupled receptors family 1 profile domain-containing protein n=1 Tax=Cylicostephanus goldi TaxID=71465 RepID=A0A3P6SYW0_CYLGO|nr:unnamed protein product [Cylicostephanus goldi]
MERQKISESSFFTAKQLVELELLEDTSDPDEKDICNNRAAINQVCWQLRKISEELPKVKLKKISATQRFLIPFLFLQNAFDVRKPTIPKGEKELAAERRRRKLKAKERQATLLLGIILSAFILSWLPFFIMYVIGAFGYEAPAVVFKFFFWLGYCKLFISCNYVSS